MLDGPQEFLELADGETKTLRITRFEVGETIIKTPQAPQGKAIDVVRVHVLAAEKEHAPYYWDISSKRLMALILPKLQAGGYQEKTFVIKASGVKPAKWFDLEVL